MKKKTVIYLLCILPALCFYSFALLIPLFFGTIPYSTYDWNLMSGIKNFTGLGNYIEILSDADTVVLSNLLAFILAYFLSKSDVRCKSVSRAFFFIPNIISSVLVAFIWYVMFAWVLPSLAQTFNIEWLKSISWFGETSHATFTIIVVSVWQSLGFSLLIYIAGFQTIPSELIEAAEMDGANSRQIFWNIELPYMLPSISMVFILALKSGLTAFDQIFAMTAGGPNNSTTSLGLLVYNYAFNNNSFGYANAIAIVLFILIAIVSFIQIKISNKYAVD